jgi:hypothetical protein
MEAQVVASRIVGRVERRVALQPEPGRVSQGARDRFCAVTVFDLSLAEGLEPVPGEK